MSRLDDAQKVLSALRRIGRQALIIREKYSFQALHAIQQRQQQQEFQVQTDIGVQKDDSLGSVSSANIVYNPSETNEDLLMSSNIKSLSRQPQLHADAKQTEVPTSRIKRLWSYGGLALTLGTSALTSTIKNVVTSSTESINPLSRERNSDLLVSTLCRMRGAALKLGQILSIQDNESIPQQLRDLMGRVRDGADFMPDKQRESTLVKELGVNWRSRFSLFEERPIAAASIGQVHVAELLDGRKVAVKIQYPGVADSIDSDLNSLKFLLNFSQLLPSGLFLENTIRVAKKELAWETDYEREAQCVETFQYLLKSDKNFYVPYVVPELSTRRVLTLEFVQGIPVDKMSTESQEIRDYIGEQLLYLSLREIFQFRYMQTDPNWSNFLYEPISKKLVLLDFGASRSFNKQFIDNYLRIIISAAEGEEGDIYKYSKALGYLSGEETQDMKRAHIKSVSILGEPFRKDQKFDFGQQNISKRLHELIPLMIKDRLVPPPEETYSLHRKLSGAFLLCSKLRSRVSCKNLLSEIRKSYVFDDVNI